MVLPNGLFLVDEEQPECLEEGLDRRHLVDVHQLRLLWQQCSNSGTTV
jgi:hypothetical protein